MKPIEYDPFADSYYTTVDDKEVWCECPITLENILHRLNERESRREDAWATGTAFVLAALVLIAAAVVAAWL